MDEPAWRARIEQDLVGIRGDLAAVRRELEAIAGTQERILVLLDLEQRLTRLETLLQMRSDKRPT